MGLVFDGPAFIKRLLGLFFKRHFLLEKLQVSMFLHSFYMSREQVKLLSRMISNKVKRNELIIFFLYNLEDLEKLSKE